MRNELAKVIKPTDVPTATIGDANLRMHHTAILKRFDFCDKNERLRTCAILFAPIAYGVINSQLGYGLGALFWILVVAAVATAYFWRSPPIVRITPGGILLPRRKSPLYPWNQMTQALSGSDQLSIQLNDGSTLRISFEKFTAREAELLTRLVKAQFRWMAQQSRKLAAA
jgi:hypothetical protein